MKYTFILLFLITGCSVPKPIALKGNYSTEPKIIETSTPLEQVWDKLIDLFAQKGLSIKIIDRSSGLIISERSVLPYSTETSTGELKTPSAFAVMPKVLDRYSKKYRPIFTRLTGEWNVRIKRNNDKTFINVNIVNIEGVDLDPTTTSLRSISTTCTSCRSTGVFESIISDMIK